MIEPRPLPDLPLTVRIPALYAHLVRLHPFDDPGWTPRASWRMRFMAALSFRRDHAEAGQE